ERSFFWPFTLIAAGVVWILINMGTIPAENLWALAHLWPFLLIALGLGLILRAYVPVARVLISALIVGGAVLAIVFAPKFGWNQAPGWGWDFGADFGANFGGSVPGSGNVISQGREENDFVAIDVRYPAEVTIQQGETEKISIEAEDNLLPQLRTQVRNGTLYIENSEGDWSKRVNPTKTVKINITVQNLEKVDFPSAGSVRIEGVKSESLRVSASGAGEIKMVKLDVRSLDCRLSGAGSVTADGVADKIELRISGVGSFDGEDLAGQSADVNISGAGSATLWVKSELSATISGAGSVDYYGSPSVSKTISGVGSVNKRGDK
ncbi:MAG: DUF2807 domain-containing protein, partial [Chloroflexi bacterium]